MSKRSPSPPVPDAAPPGAGPWLATLVFLSGGIILVLEIVGARLISPMYGSSLNVWSSLITVTLLSLAVGYEAGGRLADRLEAHRTLRALLAAAGVFTLLVPSIRGPVLNASSHLGLQAGTLAAATILLMVPLVLLSAAGVIVARATTRSLERMGRGVGRISFYSTLGSMAGALATGFFLIPSFAVSHIFYGAGALILAAIALVHLDQRRTTSAASAVIVALAAGGLLIAWPEPLRADVRLKTETFYGELSVVDSYPYRFLLLDGIHQSLWNTQTGESAGRYIHGLELAPLMAPGGRRALVIGIGAGLLPMILERHHGMVADSVDVNPKVVTVARELFGFAPKGQTTVADGRIFLRQCPAQSYDLVVLDTFNGDAVPYHLLTRELFAEVRRVLRPSGLLAVNTVALIRRGAGASADARAVAATMGTAFPHVRAFALVSDETPDPPLGNLLLFGSSHALEVPSSSAGRPVIRETLAVLLRGALPEASYGGGVVLSDDYNPFDVLSAETARVWRRRALEWVSPSR